MSLSDLRDVGDQYSAIAGAAAKLAAERSSTRTWPARAGHRDIRHATGPAASGAERHFHLEVAAAAQSPRLTHQELVLPGRTGRPAVAADHHGPSSAYPRTGPSSPRSASDGDLARTLTEDTSWDAIDRLWC